MVLALEAFARVEQRERIRFVAFDGVDPAPATAAIESFSRVAREEGMRHDIADFYSFVDVFVFPSYVEGFGLPPLEAMACGAAIVLTDSGGVREYARDGHNCLLVPAGDVTALADAIARVTTRPGAAEYRARLAEEGRATALAYAADRFADACADEIERALQTGNRS
jgi:glycosyltransferase involved in cell wall biosynthesis